jgi:hypothetical protein
VNPQTRRVWGILQWRRDLLRTLMAIDGGAVQRWVRQLVERHRFERWLQQPRELGLVRHLCWLVALHDLVGLDAAPWVQALVEALEPRVTAGCTEDAVPGTKRFPLMSAPHAVALLTRLLPAVRRGAPAVDRYGKDPEVVASYAQQAARAHLKSVEPAVLRRETLAVAERANLG